MATFLRVFNECMKEFVVGLGYFAFLAMTACLVVAAAAVIATAGTLALPAFLACLQAAGLGYLLVSVVVCFGKAIAALFPGGVQAG